MPSGITHILLTKSFQNRLDLDIPDEDGLKSCIAAGLYFFQLGAVGPDLPYASAAGNYCIFKKESPLADSFHYTRTNELPIKALQELNSLKVALKPLEIIYSFCFFLGYISHVFADGIIHPFVRDKVGDYAENSTDHRILEMRLDVLFFHYLTMGSGADINFNYSGIQNELKNINVFAETDRVMGFFHDNIFAVYNKEYDIDTILGWVKGLYRLFNIAAGKHPQIYHDVSILDGVFYKDYEDLVKDIDKIFLLTAPVDRSVNFLKRGSVHFINDCVEQFYSSFKPVALKAYNYIFNDGSPLDDSDIPPINLDTGRPLSDPSNLDIIPVLWR